MKTLRLFLAITCTAAPLIGASPLAHYPFDGNGSDIGPGGYHATVNGPTLTTDRFGRPNAAYDFDNVDDFMVASVPGLPIGNAARTVSLWARVRPDTSHGVFLVEWGTAAPLQPYGLICNGNPYTWGVTTYGGGNGLNSRVVVDSEWHHVVTVYTGSEHRIYIDGVRKAERSEAINTVLSDLYFGKPSNTFETGSYGGALDDVRVYASVLTDAEVQQLFTDDSGPTGGTFGINKTLVTTSTQIYGSFDGWADASPPLSYTLSIDGVAISPPGPATVFVFAANVADGPHTVTGRITDALGNFTEVNRAIIVDGTPPVITIPGNLTAVATDPAGVWVFYTESTVADNMDPAPLLNIGYPSGTFFPLGQYVNVVTAQDAAGNVVTSDFTITVLRGYVETTMVAQAGIVAGNRIGTDLLDAPGFKLTKLGVPSLTNRGIVAVTGAARDGTGKTLSGVLLGLRDNNDAATPPATPPAFRMPLRVGAPVPESAGLGAGLVWKAFPREPIVDYQDDDEVVAPPQAAGLGDTGTHEVGHWMGFYGRVAGAGVTTANDDVLGFYSLPEKEDEVLVLFAREGGDVPGVPGAKFKSFPSAATARVVDYREGGVNVTTHKVAFSAMLQTGPSGTPGPGGVDRTNDMGLFIFDDTDGKESVQLMLREGQQLGARTVRSFVALRGPVGHGHGFTADDDPDHYGAIAGRFTTMVLITFTDGTKQLVAASSEGIKPLATAKTTALWAGTGAWPGVTSFQSWFQNGDGRMGVLGATTFGKGIFAEDVNGDLKERVATGDVNGDGSVFTALKSPVMNRDGALAFAATVKLGTATLQRGYYQGPTGLLPYIEQNAEAASANGGVWKTTNFVALPDGMGPLFTAKLRAGSLTVPAPGGVTALNDVGLWAVDSFGTTHLLIREGQTLGGKTVRTFKALTSVAGSPAQAHSFNGKRDVIVWMLATDNTQHLVHFAVP